MSEVRVNGVTFESNVTATDGSIRIEYETADRLDEIESQFTAGLRVEVIENGEVTAIYYNKALKSLQVSGREPRKVAVVLEASPVTDAVEKNLREKISQVSSAISDVSEKTKSVMADAEANNIALGDLAQTVSGQADDAEVTAAAFAELAELVAGQAATIDELTERVTALENVTPTTTEVTEEES